MLKRLGEGIVAQHRQVLSLMDEVEARPRARAPIEALVVALSAHFRFEEKHLAPYGARDSRGVAAEEHAIMRFALRRLRASRGSREARPRLAALRHLVVHHFEAEERALAHPADGAR